MVVVVFEVTVPLPLFEGFPVSFTTETDNESLPTMGTPEPVMEAPAEFVSVELTRLVTLPGVGTSVGALTDFSLRSYCIGKEDHAQDLPASVGVLKISLLYVGSVFSTKHPYPFSGSKRHQGAVPGQH